VQRDHPDLAALVLSGPFIGGNPQVEGLLTMDPLPEVPIDPGILSRDPAVGDAYASDELVYHGPFHRVTLEATFAAVREVGAGPGFGDLPTLWIHGEGDVLSPLPVVQKLCTVSGAATSRSTSTPEHSTRSSMRSTKTRCWATWSGFCAERWG
jgi:alpha-beta hydrolase superfamily lysophospholipase